MAKVVKTALMVTVGVAAIAFSGGIAAALAPALAVSAGTITALGASLVLSGVSGLLTKTPKLSESISDRLNINYDATAPRRIVFGRTAAGSDVRFKQTYGSSGDMISLVMALASHRINSMVSISFDHVSAYHDGAATGALQGLAVCQPCAEGTRTNGVAHGDGTLWTNQSTFTGCAYNRITYVAKSDYWKNGALPSSVITVVEGCPVYDPRLDSTAGGSGPHRVNDQTTWSFKNGSTDIGRNPALCLLTYLIGYRINGKLAWGMGLPVDKIRLDNFITYANVCEEQVHAADDTYIQRYTCDGSFSTYDTHETVINSICAAMGTAVLIDLDGLYQIVGGYDDTLTTPLAFTGDDILSGGEWNPSPPIRDRHTRITGRFADPANDFQLNDWGLIELDPLYDGIPRTNNVDLGCVNRAETAQRIAKQMLLREKYSGTYTAVFGPRAFGVSVGSLMTLALPAHGFNDKLFRVESQSETDDLQFTMVLREESPEIYQWDKDEAKALPASILTDTFDPVSAVSVANLSISARAINGANSVSSNFIDVSWSQATSRRVVSIEIQAREAGVSAWTTVAERANDTGSLTFASSVNGAPIDVRARYRMSNGVNGPWVTASLAATPISTVNRWDFITDNNSGRKPDDSATNSRLLSSPFGSSTVGQTVNTLVNYGARIQTIETTTTNGTFAQAQRVATLEARTTNTSPNRVTNGDFAAGFRYWIVPGGAAHTNVSGWLGTYVSINGSGSGQVYQDVPIDAGVSYSISCEGEADIPAYAQLEYLYNVNLSAGYGAGLYVNGTGYKRGGLDPFIAPAGATIARIHLVKAAGGTYANFTRVALQANGWTVWRDDTTPLDTLARISTVETATVDGRFASASRATTLEAQMAGAAGSNLNSRIAGLETVTTNGTFSSASRTSTLESLAVVPKAGEVNPNADFSTWTDGYVYPNNWGQWSAQRIIPTNGLNGRRYAPRQDTVANENAGIANGGLYKQRGWYVIEVDARINGSFSGMGVGWYSGGEGLLLFCEHDPDINGVVRGSSENPFWVYSWRKLVYSSQEDYGAVVYGFAAYDALGSIASPRSVIWDRIAVRRATDGEIQGKKAFEGLSSKADISFVQSTAAGLDYARGQLEASVNARLNRAVDSPLYAYVREVSGATVDARNVANDARGRTNAFWGVTADAGNGRAQITAYADGYGGVVDIVGDVRIHGALTIDGTLSTGKLANNSVTVPCAVSSSDYVYGAYTNVQLLELYVDMGGSSGWIYANSTLRQSYSGGASAWNIYLLIDGNVVAYTGGGVGYSDSVAISGSAQVDGGVHHVEILCNSSSNIHYESRTLFAMGVKK